MSDQPKFLRPGIQPIRQASRETLREADEMLREAQIRGEMDWGGYGKDFASGAVGGAIVGGAAGSGVLSVPGAAIGAGIGGLGNMLMRGGTDIWYLSRSKEDKAAWQAGDLQERVEGVSQLLAKVNPNFASLLLHMSRQYKEFIDGHVQRKKIKGLEDNRFMHDPEVQQKAFEREYWRMQGLWDESQRATPAAPAAAPSRAVGSESAPKFRRYAEEIKGYLGEGAPMSQYTGDPGIGHHVKMFGADLGAQTTVNTVGDRIWLDKAKQMALQKDLGKVVKPSNLTKLNLAAIVGTLLVDGGVAAYEHFMVADSKKVLDAIRDCGKIIQVVNGLTNNDPRVVMAGNQLYSYLDLIKRAVEQARGNLQQAAKTQAAQGVLQSPQTSAPQASSVPTPGV